MMSERKITNNPNNREEQWRVIYENSPLGIELYDVKGGLIDANRACLDIFGIDDVSAVNGFMLFDDPNLSEQHKKDLREGKPVKQEIFFDFDKVKKDSLYPTSKQGTINLDLSISPLVSSDTGANSGYIVYVSDITLRKNAEAMLLEQKRFAEKVIDSSAVATFVLARDHKVVLWNGACEELTGAGASEMIGSGDHWRPFYDHRRPTPADLIIDKKHETLPALYEKSNRSALVPDGIHAEGWYSNLNGKDRYIVFDAAPIYDSKNQLIVAIETLQDMTDYKRAEEDLDGRLAPVGLHDHHGDRLSGREAGEHGRQGAVVRRLLAIDGDDQLAGDDARLGRRAAALDGVHDLRQGVGGEVRDDDG